jgi:hypothetical protein
MYEVFINNKPLVFERKNAGKTYDKKWKKIETGSQSVNNEYILSLLSEDSAYAGVIIFSSTPENYFNAFFSGYKLIEAAGGLVTNEQKQVLFIFRNGKWDLPKGKLERNETIKNAALREVSEETGLTDLTINGHMCDTFHTYTLGKKNILKKTYWFEMHASRKMLLTPQIAEGITQIKWMNKSRIKTALKNSFALIERLIDKYNEKYPEC